MVDQRSETDLKDKAVLVTGASSGIGRAMAEAFADQETKLALCALPADRDRLDQIALGMRGRAKEVITIAADLTLDDDLLEVVPQVRRRLGKVDILINNAGLFQRADVADAPLADFDRCMRLNLRAPFVLAKHVIPEMVERRWGRIINIASSSAYSGYAGTGVYCASKHGLLGLCRSMHEELRRFGIRVSVIAPSDTDTPGYRADFAVKDESTLIQPSELARTAVFLARSCGEGALAEVRVTRMRG